MADCTFPFAKQRVKRGGGGDLEVSCDGQASISMPCQLPGPHALAPLAVDANNITTMGADKRKASTAICVVICGSVDRFL